MSQVILKRCPRTSTFSTHELEKLSKDTKIDLAIMEGTLQKIERIVISKPVEELRNWCSYLNLLAVFLILLMVSCVLSILHNPNRMDRLVQVQKSWHYSGASSLQDGLYSKRSWLNQVDSYDDPLLTDLNQVISSNMDWFDNYFTDGNKDQTSPAVTQENKTAYYKQKLIGILKLSDSVSLGNLEENLDIRRQANTADHTNAGIVSKMLWGLEFSLVFVFISMTIAFAVAMRIYCGAMYFTSLRLNQQKNIRKLLEIENDRWK